MPAEKKEIEEAKQEGINFLFQNNIVEIKGNKKVEKLELIKTELVQKEGETRAVPVNIEGSNYEIDTDYVVIITNSGSKNQLKAACALFINSDVEAVITKKTSITADSLKYAPPWTTLCPIPPSSSKLFITP